MHLKENERILSFFTVVKFYDSLNAINPYKDSILSTVFDLNPEDFSSRIATIDQYETLLLPDANADHFLHVTSLFDLPVEEIYERAKNTHYKRYFMKTFLPAVGTKFRETYPTVSDEALSQMILGHTNNYSPEVVISKLSTFNPIFREMYTPPLLEKPHSLQSSSIAESSTPSSSSSSVIIEKPSSCAQQ